MGAYSYPGVDSMTPDDEELYRRFGGYAPVQPAPAQTTAPDATPPAVGGAPPAPPAAPATEDMPAVGPARNLETRSMAPAAISPQVAPAPRPTWEQYKPPEPHGWSKVGHVLAGLHPLSNALVNMRPQMEAERDYKNAVGEYEAPLEENLKTGQAEEASGRGALAAEQAKHLGEEEFKTVPNIIGPGGKILQEGSKGTLRWGSGIEGATPLRQPTEGELPLGNRVDQLNQAMGKRYQVSHPKQSLPEAYTLPPTANQKDFDRIDKLMEAEERGAGTKAQQDTANEMRRQTQQLAQQNLQDRQEKEGMKWAMWTDPSGRQVAGPVSLAHQLGAENPVELGGTEQKDILNARQAFHLMTKRGDPAKPDTQGTLQLMESLAKDDKLGILASRYNRWMSLGVGSDPGDDPRIVTLIDKNMLGQTAAMLSHFGTSGGRSPVMLAHFLDLSNAAKMDGPTLRAGTLAMADYMSDRAMLPQQGGQGGGAQATPKATHIYNPKTKKAEPVTK